VRFSSCWCAAKSVSRMNFVRTGVLLSNNGDLHRGDYYV
jgi:hypothetical protein